ncbi:MAG TPA: hypothetical protein VF188_01470 [Longimicrobiales bacterium]
MAAALPDPDRPGERDGSDDAVEIVIDRLVIDLPEADGPADLLAEEIAAQILERLQRLYDEV